jgi:hypothetical protein
VGAALLDLAARRATEGRVGRLQPSWALVIGALGL